MSNVLDVNNYVQEISLRYNQEDKKEMLPKVGNSSMERSSVRN